MLLLLLLGLVVVAQQVGENSVMFPATILFILHWLLQIFVEVSDDKIHCLGFQYRSKWATVAKKTNNGPTTKEINEVMVQKVEKKN